MAETTEVPAANGDPNITPLPVEVTNNALEITTSGDLPVWIQNCSISVDFDSNAAVTVKPEDSSDPETEPVGTTVLVVLGASNWTAADPDQLLWRYIEITNCNGEPVFVRVVPGGASTVVSSTDYSDKLYSGERAMYALSPAQEVQIVRASGTGNVCARRHLR